MIGIKNFIVHIPQRFSETIKTKSNVTIYGDRRFTPKEQANTIVEVIETPLDYVGPVKKGYRVIIDFITVMAQTYKDGENYSPDLVDREKSYYKVDPTLIIAYQKSTESKFKACHGSIICTKVLEEEPTAVKKKSILIIPETAKRKFKKDVLKVYISSEESEELDVMEDDIISVRPLTTVDIRINGEKFQWVRTRNILCKHIKQESL